jgi:hypothetical protein
LLPCRLAGTLCYPSQVFPGARMRCGTSVCLEASGWTGPCQTKSTQSPTRRLQSSHPRIANSNLSGRIGCHGTRLAACRPLCSFQCCTRRAVAHSQGTRARSTEVALPRMHSMWSRDTKTGSPRLRNHRNCHPSMYSTGCRSQIHTVRCSHCRLERWQFPAALTWHKDAIPCPVP